MPIATPQGTLDFKSVDKVTFVGASSNTVIDTTTGSLGVGVGVGGPTSNLHVVGNAFISSDLTVSGDATFSGTGALTVPAGATGDRPATVANGMIRYNSTTGFMEAYSGGVWAPIAQPPTVTGISPLSTLVSGGIAQGWNTGVKIQASSPQAWSYFGSDVAMNSDGTMIIVGMYGDNTGASDAGSAYIYTYSGGSWGSEVRITSSDALSTNDYFGRSVSMSSDGTKVIVGANGKGGNNTGAVYIFTYSGGSWDAGTKIQAASPSAADNFGSKVSMSSDGTKVAVAAHYQDSGGNGAGAVYIYTYSGGSWGSEVRLLAPDAAAGDQFGHGLAISGDGTKVIVGAHAETTGGSWSGAAYIFTYSGSSWDAGTKIVASDAQVEDNFGYDVSINSDGTKVIVGALYEDTGGSNAGAAYIFVYNGSSWDTGTKIMAPDPEVDDVFGNGVYMSSDGTKVIVGADAEDGGSGSPLNAAGTAYIFTYSGSSWDTGTKIMAPDAEAGDRFGRFVAMNSDGTKVIVGATEEGTGGSSAGAVYVFDYQATALFDASTQVFTATGTGIVSGSTVQLEGADGSLYSVVDATPPNAAGTQVTFKMGSEAVEFPPSAMSTNTSIPGYVASGSYGSNSGDAWKAFDNVVTTGSYWNASNGTYSTSAPHLPQPNFGVTTHDINGTLHIGHWIQLEIPNPVILTRAVIGSTSSGYQHGQFVILGHKGPLKELNHHGEGWTLLHAGSSYAASGSSLSTDVTTLSAGSTEAFKYFRVVIKSKTPSTSNGNIELNNVQFFGGSGSWVLAQQPYKVRINSTSGLSGVSTAVIGFPPTWTTAADANLNFNIAQDTTQTLVGTDGGGGTNRTFSLAPGSNALPAKVGGGTLTLTTTLAGGAITGQIAATGTTPMTFRLTDNTTGLFTDRAINIVGVSVLYSFSPNPFTFTNAGQTGRLGPTLATLTGHADYSSAAWRTNTAYFNLGAPSPSPTSYPSRLNGFQLWTVPVNATYKIIAKGARGGSSIGTEDGYGGQIEAHFTLTKGTKIIIVVGQKGAQPGSTTGGGGGGGATFILKDNFSVSSSYPYMGSDLSDIYMIVGGGGGGTSDYHSGNGRAGDAEMYSSGGAVGGSGASSYGGGGGTGYTTTGGGMTNSSKSSGGGSLYSTTQFFGFPGGESWTSVSYGPQDGGFGGGGAAVHHEGGAGGGYQGGSCGSYTSTNPDAGGHTFVSSTATYTGSHTTHTDQHGSVQITKM